MVTSHVTLVNDLFSAKKDLLVGEPLNAVCIRYLNGGDFDKCFKSVQDDANNTCRNFQKCRSKLWKKFENHPNYEDLQKYANICMGWMDAHEYWMTICDRYSVEEFRCIMHIDEGEVDELCDNIDIRRGGGF